MKDCTRLVVFIFSLMTFSSSHAADDCIATVDMSKLREAVGSRSASYGDLPSRIDCAKPLGNQRIVCESDVLRFMERLDHMGGVYAEENGTKRELDHSEPYGVSGLNKMLNKCSDAECICEAFKEWADSALGGMSPYEVD